MSVLWPYIREKRQMIVDHIGYAVRDIDRARTEFEGLGYTFEESVFDVDRNVCIQFGNNGEYRVELISVMDREKEAPVVDVLKKNGPTPYHICYRSSDLATDIEKLKKKNWIVMIPRARALAFDRSGGYRSYFFITGTWE